MSKTLTVDEGLAIVQEAIDVRRAITERYDTYKHLSEIVQSAALVEHSDFKGAVDAIYYLGGGWPTPNSKGRMEKLLDNFAGMYRVLTLVGKGNLVEEHLAEKGITVTLTNPIQDVELSPGDIRFLNEELDMAKFEFTPSTLSELVSLCMEEAHELQAFICKHADLIKKELKPAAKGVLEVEDEEYDRIVFLQKNIDAPKKVVKKKNQIDGSIGRFKEVVKERV